MDKIQLELYAESEGNREDTKEKEKKPRKKKRKEKPEKSEDKNVAKKGPPKCLETEPKTGTSREV